MTLRTAFTDLLSVEHPIALAPMNGTAGGDLAAAVSNGGGLGLIGGGREGSPWPPERLEWCQQQIELTLRQTQRPWRIGFITWALEPAILEQVLSYRPAAVMLSMGDPAPFAEQVRQTGACLIVQVTDLDEARQALDVGADVVVAQGSEAGERRCRSSRRWLTSLHPPQCLPPAGSQTAEGSAPLSSVGPRER